MKKGAKSGLAGRRNPKIVIRNFKAISTENRMIRPL